MHALNEPGTVHRCGGGLVRVWVAVAIAAGLGARPAAAEITLGGFDLARGGQLSLRDGNLAGNLRFAIDNSFSGVTYTAANTLTPAYLAGVDAVVISSVTGDFSATTPLSAAEQSALLDFVKAGHGAYIVTDNDSFAGGNSGPANNSFLSPFGLHTTGTLDGAHVATATDPNHPVTNGPFGPAAMLGLSFTGFFDNVGTSHVLATLNSNGQPHATVLNRGALSAGSGPVVFVSDTYPCFVLGPGTDNRMFALNTMGFIFPDSNLAGDFNNDAVVDPIDIDLLCDGIDRGGPINIFDVNNDGSITQADINFHVQNILHTKFGDTDTDGDVDLNDLGNLASGFGNPAERRWSKGNFDCDDDVDLNDLGTLASNFDGGRDAALAAFEAVVPEPAGVLLLLLPCSMRRRRSPIR